MRSVLRQVLKVGGAIGRHPVVGLLETATVIGGALKFAADTGLPQKAAEEGKALVVQGYQAGAGFFGSLFAPSAPAAPEAPAMDVGLTPAQQNANLIAARMRATQQQAARAAHGQQTQNPQQHGLSAAQRAQLQAQRARAAYQAQLNAQQQWQQQQLAAQQFDPSQFSSFQGGYYDPSQYPGGFDPSQMGIDPSQMDPSMMGFDPSQQVDPSMFVQGAFTVAGLPLFLPRNPVEVAGAAPAHDHGGCDVGCAGKAGDPEHKPCGPCAAKAAQAAAAGPGATVRISGVENATHLVIAEAAPLEPPPGEDAEVGAWVEDVGMDADAFAALGDTSKYGPANQRAWICGDLSDPTTCGWRYVTKAQLDAANAEHPAMQSAAPPRGGQRGGRRWSWRRAVRALTRPAVRPGTVPTMPLTLPARATPRARAASSVFDAARSSVNGRIVSLQRQLNRARHDAALSAQLQQRIDLLNAQNATTAAAQAALVASPTPQAAQIQQQLVTLAQTAPDQVPAMLAQLSAQVGQLSRGQDISNQAAQAAALAAQRAAAEVEAHEWQAPGTPDDSNITTFDVSPDVDQGGGGSDFNGDSLWDSLMGEDGGNVDGVRGVGTSYADITAAIDLAGVAEDTEVLSGYGLTWDVQPGQSNESEACSTCPPKY